MVESQLPRRLLLIEDDPHIAEALRFILSRDGWEVSVHADGQDAMSRIAMVRPDVVVLDVMLPGRSGLEILSELRHRDELQDLPVLVLSASGQGVAAVGNGGQTQVMAKPFANADVVAAVRDLTTT